MKKLFIIAGAFALSSVSHVEAQSGIAVEKIAIGTEAVYNSGLDDTKIAYFQNQPSTGNGTFIHNSGSVTIGDKNTENSKALLELSATDKGFLPTRLTSAQINALGASASERGMIVYDTTKKCLSLFDGSAWNCVGGSGSGAVFVDYKIVGAGGTFNANNNQAGFSPYIVKSDDYLIEWQAKSTNALGFNVSIGNATPYTLPLGINAAANFILPDPATCKGRQLKIYNNSYEANYPSGAYTYIWTNYPIYNTANSGQFAYGLPAVTNYQIAWGANLNKVTITSNGTYWVSDNYNN